MFSATWPKEVQRLASVSFLEFICHTAAQSDSLLGLPSGHDPS
jgi:hypothetical protein